MLEAGKKFRHLVQFSSGQPTSDLTYTLYNQNGDVVLTETVPVSVGQVSYLITIPAGSNSLSKPLFEQMTLEWEYTTATEAVDDQVTYMIHTPIGFPVSAKGVRDLLGVDADELPDNEISLFEAYLGMVDLAGEDTDLTLFDTGDLDSFKIGRAIEALAALAVFPTLQIRLPRKYDSGTSSYERWNNINWEALESSLTGVVNSALLVLDPNYEIVPVIDIFVLSDRGPDATTGA